MIISFLYVIILLLDKRNFDVNIIFMSMRMLFAHYQSVNFCDKELLEMKKKGLLYTLIIALVLSAIFGLTACGDNNKEKYTIAFETNGGSTVESITVNKGDSVNLPNTTKDRYEFEGWFETAEFNGKSISSPYTPSGNVTLYAKFTETKYNVTFMNGIDVFAIQNIALDSYAMKPEIDPIPPPP